MDIDFYTATPEDIASAFDERMDALAVAPRDRSQALAAARAAASMWCFLRDDGQLEATGASLAHFAKFSGPCSVQHHLKRRDIPAPLLKAARGVFVDGPGASALSSAWDDRLHAGLFAPFALANSA